jgi:ABC-type sugar transport system ATPase subunit
MSGRDIAAPAAALAPNESASELLRVDKLTVAASGDEDAEHVPIREVSFSLRKGEVLGIYGLLGAGRTELLECLAGLRPSSTGAIALNGLPLRLNSVAAAVEAGIHLVPEDRQRDGLVPELSIRENIALAAPGSVFLNRQRESAAVKRIADELNIAAPNLELPVAALSGGNQQKVLIARCLLRSPALLLLDEPTRGVDVGSKAEIYAILRRLASSGIGILFTSSEIEETQALAGRALVLCQGQISAVLERSELTDEALFAAASPVVREAYRSHSGAACA